MVAELAPELVPMLSALEMPANFVPVTNAVLSEMQRRGVARDQLLTALRRMGEDMPCATVAMLQVNPPQNPTSSIRLAQSYLWSTCGIQGLLCLKGSLLAGNSSALHCHGPGGAAMVDIHTNSSCGGETRSALPCSRPSDSSGRSHQVQESDLTQLLGAAAGASAGRGCEGPF